MTRINSPDVGAISPKELWPVYLLLYGIMAFKRLVGLNCSCPRYIPAAWWSELIHVLSTARQRGRSRHREQIAASRRRQFIEVISCSRPKRGAPCDPAKRNSNASDRSERPTT